MLVYSLCQNGFFDWWQHLGDPTSIYVDDNALFALNVAQIQSLVEHIQMVGSYTRLWLNLENTIAFCPAAKGSCFVASIEVDSCPVKYLGAYLGTGDLSKLNFEKPL